MSTPADVVKINTESTESESSTESVSHALELADEGLAGDAETLAEDTEALTEDTEPQYSNNALMDGVKFVSDQVRCIEERMNNHDFTGLRQKLEKIEVDVRKIKTTQKTIYATMSAFTKNLTTSTAAHHSEILQITSALVTAVQMIDAIETKSGAPSVEYRTRLEMAGRG